MFSSLTMLVTEVCSLGKHPLNCTFMTLGLFTVYETTKEANLIETLCILQRRCICLNTMRLFYYGFFSFTLKYLN